MAIQPLFDEPFLLAQWDFVETWGYHLQGQAGADAAYPCRPQYEVARAGQSGAPASPISPSAASVMTPPSPNKKPP